MSNSQRSSADARTYHVGEIDGAWAVYHREPDPFVKYGTRRVVDAWAGTQRLAEAARRELAHG